ncbi:MAG: RDD family protein [Bdellovibrionaceae bacterium]|nr:RDD family protein [Pseudobdellovibrionaceae bacterium]
MDPFEEFEFKPLTEGLGFHKKKASTVQKSDEDDISFEIKSTGSKLSSNTSANIEHRVVDPLRSPLPRKNLSSTETLPVMDSELPSAASAVDEILKTLQKNRRLDFDNQAAQKAANLTLSKEVYKPDTWRFSSSLLDSMLVLAASLLCMIIVLVITKADLIANLTNPDAEGMIYISTFGLLASVSFIYLTINRIFLGSTPGEWAFEQRIGKPQDMNTVTYPLRILARSVLVILTGFIVLPTFSILLNRDLAGELTGAPLLKKV